MILGRIRFGPQKPEPLRGDLFDERMATLIQTAKQRHYSEGMADGIEGTLRLLLGHAWAGGQHFQGELPDDVRAWAEAALEKVAR